MKFLVDVNAGGASANFLSEQGHDVQEVRNRNPRMSDEEILNWAVSERRIILTADKDFEEMVWLQGKQHCGILRLENLPRQDRLKLLHDVLHLYGNRLEAGAIVIATRTKFRVRHPFP